MSLEEETYHRLVGDSEDHPLHRRWGAGDATMSVGAELRITPAEGRIHAGEWETSMMLALRPEPMRMERLLDQVVRTVEES